MAETVQHKPEAPVVQPVAKTPAERAEKSAAARLDAFRKRVNGAAEGAAKSIADVLPQIKGLSESQSAALNGALAQVRSLIET